MRLNKKLLWIILVAIVICVGSGIVIHYLDIHSEDKALVDSKIVLLAQRYQGLNDDDIIERDGGYNTETGRYEYRFVWYHNFQETAVLKYEGVDDLTLKTLDQVYAIRLSEEKEQENLK